MGTVLAIEGGTAELLMIAWSHHAYRGDTTQQEVPTLSPWWPHPFLSPLSVSTCLPASKDGRVATCQHLVEKRASI